ncbi:MAG TPA: LLM class flavin-dependent oxidoreductase [Acetobacteraceae bacterium]|jgi:FMN-dependent oxidoreductase (nitrilotriacetate monooxygenase family)|nr:LLM class flavin-dependent oxidoreductase [Acetobacteraceae bacterium]
MSVARQMRLGLSMRYHGYHLAAWRHPDVPAAGPLDFHYFLNTTRIAERAKFDMVFLADGIGIRTKDEPEGALCRSQQTVELEPLTLFAAIATHTTQIGFVATASTTYNEPYHIARKFASLDHISGGRAGWNIVTSWSDEEARNFNRDKHLDYATRYERAEEFVRVVTGLWNSWEDDAMVRDKASGLYFDPTKMHLLNHVGKHFKVRGPLSSIRTPQGRPILVQAGAAEQGQEIAGAYAEVVYAAQMDIASAQTYYASVKGRAVKHGRSPDAVKVMPGLTTFVGRTEAAAQAKYDDMRKLIHPKVGLAVLYNFLGDLSGYPLDGPVPDLRDDVQVRSIGNSHLEMARRENLTIRQLYERQAAGFGGRVLIGTPEQIADDMQAWFENGAADGFNICPTHLPGGLEDFATLVVPELQRRGLFRMEYEGATLRENLGVPSHVNPHQSGASSRAAE